MCVWGKLLLFFVVLPKLVVCIDLHLDSSVWIIECNVWGDACMQAHTHTVMWECRYRSLFFCILFLNSILKCAFLLIIFVFWCATFRAMKCCFYYYSYDGAVNLQQGKVKSAWKRRSNTSKALEISARLKTKLKKISTRLRSCRLACPLQPRRCH